MDAVGVENETFGKVGYDHALILGFLDLTKRTDQLNESTFYTNDLTGSTKLNTTRIKSTRDH